MCVFALVPVLLVLGMSTFVLQAVSISAWLRVRAIQPVLYVSGVVGLAITHRATLGSAVAVLVGSTVAQAAWSVWKASHLPALREAAVAKRSKRLLSFGLASLFGTAPTLVTTRLDQAVLSTSVPLADLAQYAVAVAISTLLIPLVASLGQVALPHLAAAGDNASAELSVVRSALAWPPIVSFVGAVPLVPLTYVVVPRVLGESYSDVPELVVVLLVGSVGLASGNVLGDVLRGLGKPRDVGLAQTVGAVATVGGLLVAVPRWGVIGAAIVSSVTYCVTWAMLVALVRRAVAEDDHP